MYGQAAEGHANNTDNKQLITYNLQILYTNYKMCVFHFIYVLIK